MASGTVRWKDRQFALLDRAGLARIAGDDGRQQKPRPFI
jgi:hypothetical protein